MGVLIFAVGDVVRVGPAYRGSGAYQPDGNEGIYTVVKVMLGGVDYKLCRGVYGEVPPASEWDLISHASRLAKEGV